MLIDHIPPTYKTHFNKRLQSYTQFPSGKVGLAFEDGSRETCDILIGADGIKSVVRRCLLNEQAKKATSEGRLDDAQRALDDIEPSWTGIVAYRALIPTEKLQAYKDAHPDENIRIPHPKSIPTMVCSSSRLSY